jgi:hypothetical protein
VSITLKLIGAVAVLVFPDGSFTCAENVCVPSGRTNALPGGQALKPAPSTLHRLVATPSSELQLKNTWRSTVGL